MTHYLFGITWAQAHYFFLIFFVVGMCAVIWHRLRITQRVARLLSFRNFSLTRSRLRAVLMAIGVCALFIAVLRPQWGQKEVIIKQEGRDLFIALDVSRSMLATDCMPNRLTLAKQKIKELLPLLGCERIGLILFSGSAFVQCPLTVDYQAFMMFLDAVDAETISSGTTDLAQPIYRALDVYKQTPHKTSKLMVIFTDGEDFSSQLTSCKQRIQDENLKLFTVGVGTTDGAPIPLYDEAGKTIGHQKDQYGKVVITRLNEATLHSLCEGAGGMYVRFTDDASDMKSLVSHVQTFEKEIMEDKNVDLLEDRYHYFLLISFICFALDWIL